MAVQISAELWLAIMVFLAQEMDALFRKLDAMTEEERKAWQEAQAAEYKDHMAWLRAIIDKQGG